MTKNVPNVPVGARLSRPEAEVIRSALIVAAFAKADWILCDLDYERTTGGIRYRAVDATDEVDATLEDAVDLHDFATLAGGDVTPADCLRIQAESRAEYAAVLEEALALVRAATPVPNDLPRVMSAGAAGVV